MWQPTQYYHTKMQLAKMELEGKMLPGKDRKPKRKTGSGPIMEKMRLLEMADEPDDWYEAEDSAEQQAQDEEMIPESQSAAQVPDPEIIADTEAAGKTEQMQDRMIWAEILGEPISVKRRKKRMEQIYGNQGHAYRR